MIRNKKSAPAPTSPRPGIEKPKNTAGLSNINPFFWVVVVCSVEMVLGFAVVDEERVVCFVPLVHVPFTGSHVSLTHWLQLSRQPSPYVPNEHSFRHSRPWYPAEHPWHAPVSSWQVIFLQEPHVKEHWGPYFPSGHTPNTAFTHTIKRMNLNSLLTF